MGNVKGREGSCIMLWDQCQSQRDGRETLNTL
jgi:hypothetical protein